MNKMRNIISRNMEKYFKLREENVCLKFLSDKLFMVCFRNKVEDKVYRRF